MLSVPRRESSYASSIGVVLESGMNVRVASSADSPPPPTPAVFESDVVIIGLPVASVCE